MTPYNIIDRYLFLPLGDVVYGSRVAASLKEMQHTATFSAEELRSLQDSKLQRLVRHSYDTVPYYHRLFDRLKLKPEDIHSRDDLQLLPVLTKQTIRDNMPTCSVRPSAPNDGASRRQVAAPGRRCSSAPTMLNGAVGKPPPYVHGNGTDCTSATKYSLLAAVPSTNAKPLRRSKGFTTW